MKYFLWRIILRRVTQHICPIINKCEKEGKNDQSSLFLQYARAEYDGYSDSALIEKDILSSVPETNVLESSTFRQITNPNNSFEGSELKKQVGLNDNLSKALASLSIGTGVGGASLSAADAGAAAIEAGRAMSVTVRDGRPLTNLETANGRVPLYGCDDAPLPIPNETLKSYLKV